MVGQVSCHFLPVAFGMVDHMRGFGGNDVVREILLRVPGVVVKKSYVCCDVSFGYLGVNIINWFMGSTDTTQLDAIEAAEPLSFSLSDTYQTQSNKNNEEDMDKASESHTTATLKWQLPPVGCLKLNLDVAIQQEVRFIKSGIIDEDGDVMDAQSKKTPGLFGV
ncbi:Uncharacterized protein Fot_12140 [Forsythia ovata]|uniref:Uncharacterized protein n=1 Tax=Forsythia ovata TaxID=205694 RepID=A0ABD1WQI4_9LAMI